MAPQEPAQPIPLIKLESPRYKPDPKDLQALRERTGIEDEQELMDLVLEVQKEAYAVFPYMGIRRFRFLRRGAVGNHPHFEEALNLSQQPGAIYMDLGCGFGMDLRMAASRSCPIEKMIGNDLYRGFWDLSHKLNRDAETLPIPCISGSVFESSILDLEAPIALEPPTLTTLTSLTPLKGYVTVLHTKSFFHLFPQAEQEDLVVRIHALMSKKPGSFIFGSQSAKDDGAEGNYPNPRGETRYLHSPRSFRALWEKAFGTDKVEIECLYGPSEWIWDEEESKAMNFAPGEEPRHGWLTWMVKVISE